MSFQIIYCCLVGLVSGLFSGMIGIGGGVILVPMLAWMYSFIDVPNEHIMHYAVSSSIASIVCTTAISVRVHYLRRAISWHVVRALVPGLLFGAICGAWLNNQVSTGGLQIIFGLTSIISSINILLTARGVSKSQPTFLAINRLRVGPVKGAGIGSCVGVIASLLGLGGGFILVPVLHYLKLTMRNAIAAASACSFIVSLFALLSHLVFEQAPAPSFLPYTTGYVHWVAVLGILLSSLLSAYLGASLVYKIPEKKIKLIFGIFLMGVGLKMIQLGVQ